MIVAIQLIDAVSSSRQMASLSLLFIAASLFGLDQVRDAFNSEAIKKRDADLIAPFASVPA